MVIIRGVNVYPSVIEEVVRGNGEISEYQVEIDRVDSLPQMRIAIEAKANDGDAVAASLAAETAAPALASKRSILARNFVSLDAALARNLSLPV